MDSVRIYSAFPHPRELKIPSTMWIRHCLRFLRPPSRTSLAELGDPPRCLGPVIPSGMFGTSRDLEDAIPSPPNHSLPSHHESPGVIPCTGSTPPEPLTTTSMGSQKSRPLRALAMLYTGASGYHTARNTRSRKQLRARFNQREWLHTIPPPSSSVTLNRSRPHGFRFAVIYFSRCISRCTR